MGNADYWYRRAGRKRATASVSANGTHRPRTQRRHAIAVNVVSPAVINSGQG